MCIRDSGDDVHALAGEGVEVGRQNDGLRFAFTGLHLRDAALVQHDAAEKMCIRDRSCPS